MNNIELETMFRWLRPERAVVVLLLLAALSYALLQEEPIVLSSDSIVPIEPDVALQPKKVQSVDSLIDGLRRRLDEQPGDMKGWVLLGKSYHHLQRWQDAGEAFEKAKALGYEGEVPAITEGSFVSQKNRTSQAYPLGGFSSNVLTRQLEQLIIAKPQGRSGE